MSLREKLSVIKENLNEAKAAEESEKNKKELEIQNKELAPVRAHIKELEKNRQLMVIIQGSLELKETDKTGFGMKGYADETGKKINKETERINGLISENKEVLQSVGVNNREELLAKPEFAEDEEIVSFKKAENQVTDLEISDEALKQKLSELGVAINDKNFSYEEAAAALSKKISEIDLEILQEKAKTPEGRPDVLEGLTKNLVKALPEMGIGEADYQDQIKVIINRRQGVNFSLLEHHSSFNPNLLSWVNPDEVKELEKSFDPELVQEALKNAYHVKIEEIVNGYNSKYEANNKNKAQKPLIDEKNKTRMKQFIDQSLIARQIYKKLEKEYRRGGFTDNYFSIQSVENLINHVKNNQVAARSAIVHELSRVKKEFEADTKIRFNGRFLYFPDVYAKTEEIEKKRKEQNEEMTKNDEDLTKHRNSKPGFFGKEKWNKKNEELEERKKAITLALKNLEQERLDVTRKSQINLGEEVDLGDHGDINGTAEEIEKYLREINDTQLPENLIKLYDEYKEAENVLQKI